MLEPIVDAARKSFELIASGQVDLCFLAVDPKRAEQVTFTSPYLVIEGVYAVPHDSPLLTVADVDQAGVRIRVKEGSAYDLHLSRELQHAGVVRGAEGMDVFLEQGLEVGAGIRQPVGERVAGRSDLVRTGSGAGREMINRPTRPQGVRNPYLLARRPCETPIFCGYHERRRLSRHQRRAFRKNGPRPGASLEPDG